MVFFWGIDCEGTTNVNSSGSRFGACDAWVSGVFDDDDDDDI